MVLLGSCQEAMSVLETSKNILKKLLTRYQNLRYDVQVASKKTTKRSKKLFKVSLDSC